MIRRSTAFAIAAIVLSLLVHFLGLSFTAPSRPEQSAQDAATDVVAMGNAFEDLAEAPSEPVPPEPAPAPEPVEAAPEPEPEPADTPTSEALVASSDPKRVFAPDTGAVPVQQRETTGPSEPNEAVSPEPETLEATGGDEGTNADAAVIPPVEADSSAQAPEGNPDATSEPVDAVAAEPVRPPSVAPAPQQDAEQQSAALSVPTVPALPVTPAPEPSEIPIIPLDSETVDPEIPETTVEPAPEVSETEQAEDDTGGSELAVASSPRPRPAPRRPLAEPLGQIDGTTGLSETDLAPTKFIESPLTAYQRDGTDLIIQQNRRAQSGGVGFLDSRGPGNSDVTNYAGQVLVHLNRTPVVHVSARGAAKVYFEISSDGSLAWVEIIDSTGSLEIETAAKQQIRRASPFPRPPNGGSRQLSFVYRID